MTLSQLRRHIIGSELPQSFPVRAKGFLDTFVQVHQLLMEYVLAGMIGRFEVQVVLPRSDERKVNYAHARYTVTNRASVFGYISQQLQSSFIL